MAALAAYLIGIGAALGAAGLLFLLAARLVARLHRRDDLTALADAVLVDQSQVDARFAAIARSEPDVTALGRAIAADLYCTEEDL